MTKRSVVELEIHTFPSVSGLPELRAHRWHESSAAYACRCGAILRKKDLKDHPITDRSDLALHTLWRLEGDPTCEEGSPCPEWVLR